MGYGGFGNSFRGGNGGKKFEPKPGEGTLFVKAEKRSQTSPNYDGYFIADRDIRAGEKIKLVGWDKPGNSGHKINLKVGREPQNAPGFDQQSGYQPQQQYGGQFSRGPVAPQQGRYQPPAQHQPGAYQGGGYGVQPLQTYPPAQQAPGQVTAPATQPQAPSQPNYALPAPGPDLPF